jgi:phage terminase small subunit
MMLSNSKHEQFAQLVAKGATATEAAQAVGYSEISARKQGSRLQTNADIRARIEELKKNIAEATVAEAGITNAWVVQKLKENVERAMQIVAVLDPDGGQLGSYKYDGNVANRALELIGKELGMFKTEVKHSGEVKTSGTLRVEFVRSPVHDSDPG